MNQMKGLYKGFIATNGKEPVEKYKGLNSFRCYVEDHIDYYYHVGIEEQIRSGCSSVEKIVLRRERLKNRQENRLKRKYQKDCKS